MANDEMWNWLTNPLVGLKAQAPTPTTLKMRPPAGNTGSTPDAGQPNRDIPADPPKDDDKDTRDVGAERAKDPVQEEADAREKQKDDAKKSNQDRMADAAKSLVKKYTQDNLGKLKEQALNDLARAWQESPGGVIAAGAILGAAGVTYLVKTGTELPELPAIPLDFLAGKAPVFKGAELNIVVKGPITGPESIMVSITFHEKIGKGDKPKGDGGRGKAFTPRMTLSAGGAKADGPEPGADLEIEGDVPIPSKASSDDVSATIKAIKNGKAEVDIGSTPTYWVEVLSVEDNYKPGPYGLGAPPTNRALKVRLHTTVPAMMHQGKDEVSEASVWVRLNGVSNEGEAKIKVHYQELPTAGKK